MNLAPLQMRKFQRVSGLRFRELYTIPAKESNRKFLDEESFRLDPRGLVMDICVREYTGFRNELLSDWNHIYADAVSVTFKRTREITRSPRLCSSWSASS